jgi:hypothetical protein
MSFKRCHGCGGVIGLDCFNPTECEQITRSLAEQAQSEGQQNYLMSSHIESLKSEIEELKKQHQLELRQMATKCWYAGVNYANDHGDHLDEDCRHPDKKTFFASLFPNENQKTK